MGTKTISITEDVYNELSKLKRSEESFSDELRRIVRAKGKISECAGLWSKWMSKEDMNSIEASILERRKASRSAKLEKERKK